MSESHPGDEVATSLLTSRDGVTWSRTSVDDLVGGSSYGVQRIVIKDDRAVAIVNQSNPGRAHTRQLAVVGTPR